MDRGGQGIRISTPEAVSFTMDTAGVGARYFAASVDTMILMLLLGAVTTLLSILYAVLAAFQGGENIAGHLFDTARYLVIALIMLAMFIIIWGYYIFFEYTKNGATPGKRAAGIRVVKADGSPLTFADVAVRNLIRVIDFMPSMYLVGSVSIMASKRGQRLGDLAAGTVVVHERGYSYVGKFDPYGRREIAGRCRIALEPREYEAVTSFLLRRREFNPMRRAYLAARLAPPVSLKYNLPLERFPDNESMLDWLFTDIGAQAAPGAPVAKQQSGWAPPAVQNAPEPPETEMHGGEWTTQTPLT